MMGSVFRIYNKSFSFLIIILYVKWDQKDEMGRKIVFLNGGNRDVENKTGILYNDTVEQLKGCGAAW